MKYEVTKVVKGKTKVVIEAETELEAQYVVNALKANGIKSAEYRNKK